MITFIILTRNNPDYLKKCLESIQHQTRHVLDAIIIDTGDTQISKKVCEEYGVKHWEYANDYGFAFKNNLGIKEALKNQGCKYVCLLNDDAYINKNFVEDIIKYSKQSDPNVMAFSPLYIYANEPDKIQVMGGGMFSDEFSCGEKQIYHDVNLEQAEEIILVTPQEIDFGYGAAIVYKKEVFDKVGFLDEHLRHGFDEPDFAKRMKLKNLKILYVPTTVHHVCGGSSKKKSFLKNLPTTLYMNRGYLYFLLKHYPAEFAVKQELKRLKGMLRHPKALLIEIYCILWNIYEATENRMVYHELYDPKDTETQIIGGVQKEVKLKKHKLPFKERMLDTFISYSMAICLLSVPIILYIAGMIL